MAGLDPAQDYRQSDLGGGRACKDRPSLPLALAQGPRQKVSDGGKVGWICTTREFRRAFRSV